MAWFLMETELINRKGENKQGLDNFYDSQK